MHRGTPRVQGTSARVGDGQQFANARNLTLRWAREAEVWETAVST